MDEQYGKLIEPSPVPFSFGAPGWYVLDVLLLLALLFIGWLLFRFYKNNLYRKEALKFLHKKEQELNHQPLLLVYETNMLLKRIAMGRYGRENIASVRDTEWTDLLNKTMRQNLFNSNDKILIQQTLYSGNTHNEADTGEFINKAKTWITKHHRNYAF